MKKATSITADFISNSSLQNITLANLIHEYDTC
jgi:hypothetical protein